MEQIQLQHMSFFGEGKRGIYQNGPEKKRIDTAETGFSARRIKDSDPPKEQENYRRPNEAGLLKIEASK